ncbi:MAG: zinc ribbon domain-containing protein [Ruminococcus sp.]|nr:zinc ribbon domain-containing protein [Ruminococcus sp.]
MICPNCNHEVSDLAVVCPNCGASLNNNSYNTPETEQKANGGFIALTIFFPIVGIILGIIEINKGNKSVGKKYLWTAIIAWVVWFLLGCCIGLVPFLIGLLATAGETSTSYSYYSYAVMPFLF